MIDFRPREEEKKVANVKSVKQIAHYSRSFDKMQKAAEETDYHGKWRDMDRWKRGVAVSASSRDPTLSAHKFTRSRRFRLLELNSWGYHQGFRRKFLYAYFPSEMKESWWRLEFDKGQHGQRREWLPTSKPTGLTSPQFPTTTLVCGESPPFPVLVVILLGNRTNLNSQVPEKLVPLFLLKPSPCPSRADLPTSPNPEKKDPSNLSSNSRISIDYEQLIIRSRSENCFFGGV